MPQRIQDSDGTDIVRVNAGSPEVVVSATPTLDTSIYASGDSLHTAVITFTGAVGRSGGYGKVKKMVVVDASAQTAAFELWLFSATVTPAAANSVHSISDADAALCVGVIASGTYFASALNSVCVTKGVDLDFKVAGTSLFGILVTRSTPTYLAGSLTVSLQIEQKITS